MGDCDHCHRKTELLYINRYNGRLSWFCEMCMMLLKVKVIPMEEWVDYCE